jgi:MacB-like periplasmic core domain
MTTVWQDVLYGFRMLLKKPGFTAIAAFSLALGIGANTAIFSLVNMVLLNSLPYRDSGRLVMIETTPPGHPEKSEGAMVPDYIAWKEQSRSFEALGVATDDARDIGSEENGRAAERISSMSSRCWAARSPNRKIPLATPLPFFSSATATGSGVSAAIPTSSTKPSG